MLLLQSSATCPTVNGPHIIAKKIRHTMHWLAVAKPFSKKKKKTCIALHEISELRSVTCHMGSHSVTCHPTKWARSALTPALQAGTRFCLPRRDGRLSLPCYSETQPPVVELATSRSRIQRPNHVWLSFNDVSEVSGPNIFSQFIVTGGGVV